MPRVSICIPTYNRRDLLAQTLISIKQQTYTDFQVVILDDGSTDGTEEVVKNSGLPVKYHWFEHIGMQRARNKLIELADTELITFFDSDDIFLPDGVKLLVEACDKHGGNVMTYGSYNGIDQNGNIIERKQMKMPSGKIAPDLFEFIYVHTGGTLGPRQAFVDVNGFDESILRCSIYKTFLLIALKYDYIAVDQPLFLKRRHSGNLNDRNFQWRKIELDMLEDFYYNLGGKDVIPADRAARRLGKEAYRAGICAVREGLRPEAITLLRQSLARHTDLKSLAWFVAAALRIHPGLW